MDSPELTFLYGIWDSKIKKRRDKSKNISPIKQVLASEQTTKLEKFNFHLPMEGFDQKIEFLGENELKLLAKKFKACPTHKIRKKIIAYEEGGLLAMEGGKKLLS